MFLKEPELKLAQIGDNGNFPQVVSYPSNPWLNSEVSAYPISPGESNYGRFIIASDSDGQARNDPLTRDSDGEMRSDEASITGLSNGESRLNPYHDNNTDLDNNTRQNVSDRITDFMKYELNCGRGLERQIQEDRYLNNCANSDQYIDPEVISSLSQSCYDCQTDEALFNYEETDRSCSSTDDITPQDDDERMFEASDSDDSYIHDSEEQPLPRGIHNPNYPGFQHLAYTLQDYPMESPNSYENSLFSNINSANQNHEEFERLTKFKQFNSIFDESNNNIVNHDDDERDGIVHDTDNKFQSKSESLENIANLRRSEVITIPIQQYPRRIPYSSYEDDGGEFVNGYHSSISHVSTDLFVYSDSVDSREITLNQDVFTPSNNQEENSNLSQVKHAFDFEDDIVALQRDIYEEIQKPLATTIENISDVVNNVIKSIVDHEHAIEDDAFKQFTNALSSNQYLKEEERLRSKIFDFKEVNKEDFCESDTRGENSYLITDENKLKMDDAYMSNVKEELFSSQSSESYSESVHSCDEEMSSSFELYKSNVDENKKIQEIFSNAGTDTNCNFSHSENVKENFTQVVSNSNEFIESITPQDKKENRTFDNNQRNVQTKKDDFESSITKSLSKGKKNKTTATGGFDVYNIETAMPLIDLDVIENHLRAAREEERRRRNDREEIRRRLAMGAEVDEFYTYGDRPGRKPSLHARLQSGMNLQICFMNETASDTESPSETELGDSHKTSETNSDTISMKCKELNDMSLESNGFSKLNTSTSKKLSKGITRPSSLALNDTARPAFISNLTTQAAFFECQARLQTEARMALAQAKEMARMQMEIERQKQENSPITEMLRSSLLKAGVQMTGDRRRVSRQMLTDMNVAQLQVIVNELHTQIEYLNESLVKLLIARDELHMGQDSMLVDIEDLTRHLSAKEMPSKGMDINNESPSGVSLGKQQLKSHLSAFTSLLNK